MALPPQYAGHRLSGAADAPHSLEFYLDYVCPFSAKIWNQVYNHVLPWLEKEHPDRVQVIFRNQIQPWHPASTLTAEAALAVEKVNPTLFASYSNQLFIEQKRFFDEAVVNASRAQVYSALVSLASSASPSTKDKIHSLLEIKHVDNAQEATNTGNKVANDLKYFVKLGRQNGIHVSPTALWDGLVENSISSSWTLDNWKEFFQSKILA